MAERFHSKAQLDGYDFHALEKLGKNLIVLGRFRYVWIGPLIWDGACYEYTQNLSEWLNLKRCDPR